MRRVAALVGLVLTFTPLASAADHSQSRRVSVA